MNSISEMDRIERFRKVTHLEESKTIVDQLKITKMNETNAQRSY